MRWVYADAAVARSIAFLNRAVAINSIVRVILRIFRIDFRRLSRARAFAMLVDHSKSVWVAIADAFVGLQSTNDVIDDTGYENDDRSDTSHHGNDGDDQYAQLEIQMLLWLGLR